MKLLVISSLLVTASAACDATRCAEWSCTEWCSCFDTAAVKVYEANGCVEDGTEECDCRATTDVVITPNKWGGCPNGNADLVKHACPDDAGTKCWGGDQRGFFNNGDNTCKECPAIDGCQLNRPLYGITNACACHTCYPQYSSCPVGETCGLSNEKTGEQSVRMVSRYLAEDKSQCDLCPHSEADGCTIWGKKYGVKGVEACECQSCHKGWKKHPVTGNCVKFMVGAGSQWSALPAYPKGWSTLETDLKDWQKLEEGDAKGYCNNFDGNFEHGKSKQHNKYTTNLYKKTSKHADGRFDPKEVTEMVEECKKRCDRETEFTCISFSVSIAKTTLWCKGSPNVPTITTTKQDAECWRKY